MSKREASPVIAEKLDIEKILKRASKGWDGGYAMAGLFGHGDAFVFRDPAGIRPAYFYEDDEIVVVLQNDRLFKRFSMLLLIKCKNYNQEMH